MTGNDIFLILTWVVGIGSTVISAFMARKRVRAEAQLILDKASFQAATDMVELLREQLNELREELKIMRGEMNALRAREGKLLNRIKILEYILVQNGVTIPPENGTS